MSRQLDSLLKGLSIFKEGMTDLMTSRAINDAQKELQTAKITFGAREGMSPEQLKLEEENMENTRNAIAQNLAGRLAGIGASGTQIQAATSFGLMRPQELSMQLAKEKAAQPKQVDPFKVADLQFKQDKKVTDTAEQFEKSNKPLLEQLESGRTAKELISIAKGNPAAAGALPTVLAKQLQPGNLTEKEQAAFKGKQDLLSAGSRLLNKWTTGNPLLPEDVDILDAYIDTVYSANKTEFIQRQKNFMESNKNDFLRLGIDPGRLEERMGQFDVLDEIEKDIVKQFPEAAKDPQKLRSYKQLILKGRNKGK